MSGPPFRPGFTQVAVRLVAEPSTAVTVGFAGVSVCSSAFITVTVIVWSAVFTRASVPLVARTTTT